MSTLQTYAVYAHMYIVFQSQYTKKDIELRTASNICLLFYIKYVRFSQKFTDILFIRLDTYVLANKFQQSLFSRLLAPDVKEARWKIQDGGHIPSSKTRADSTVTRTNENHQSPLFRSTQQRNVSTKLDFREFCKPGALRNNFLFRDLSSTAPHSVT